MKRSNGFDRIKVAAQAFQIIVISLFLFMLAGCGQRLRRLESNQVIMEEKVDGNTNRIEILTYKMEKSQNRLQAGIEEVKRGNEITLAEAIATRYEQRKLREASEANDDMIRSGVGEVGVRQQILKQSIGQIESRAKEIVANVEALAIDQQSLQKRISGDYGRVVTEIGEVKENQEKTHGVSAEALVKAETMAEGIKGIQHGQASLSRTVKENGQQLTAEIRGVARKQKEMHETLSDTHGVSLIIASNVGQIQAKQNSMHQVFQAKADTLDEKVTDVQRRQGALISGIEKNRELGHAIVADVNQVQIKQNGQMKTMEANVATLDNTVSASTTSLESRLAALSDAMRDYQQGREEVDASIAEGLASLAQALEQIKVNQMLLSRRLGQTRDDARRYNEQFRTTLEQLEKESREAKSAPKTRPMPVKDEDIESEK